MRPFPGLMCCKFSFVSGSTSGLANFWSPPRHLVADTTELRTPTGHSYHSTATPLPGTVMRGTVLREAG